MKYEVSFTHDLLAPFKYQKKGDFVDAQSLVVYAPSSRIIPYVSILESETVKAVVELRKNSNANENEIKLAKEMQANKYEKKDYIEDAQQTIMFLAAGADLQKCYHAFRDILTNGTQDSPTCLIDGVEKMNASLYDKVSQADMKLMMGRYINSFLDIFPNS